MSEHDIQQEIIWLFVAEILVLEMPSQVCEWRVGRDGVTRIEAFTKSGMYADIPYLRVWRGQLAVAEYCQHNIVGVGFKELK